MSCKSNNTPLVAPPARAARRAAAGFTLIEILVVVVILGIVSAVIVPQIGSSDDLRTSSAARALMADLIYAQNLAVTRQQTVYVKFDAAAEHYKVLTAVSPSETVITHPVLLSPYLVSLGTNATTAQLRNVVIDTVSFDGQTIVAFDEMGVPYAVTAAGASSAMTAGSIKLKCGTYTLTVTLEPFTGELKVN
jgi:prepilin-type N-terminal cleavage/methylation domain-containing protein